MATECAWLITLNEWFCLRDSPSLNSFARHTPAERVVAVASRLPFNGALAELCRYQDAFHARHPSSAISLRVTHMSPLPRSTDFALLATLGVRCLDDMVEAIGDA